MEQTDCRVHWRRSTSFRTLNTGWTWRAVFCWLGCPEAMWLSHPSSLRLASH